MDINDIVEKMYTAYHTSKGTFAHYIVWDDVSIWEKRHWFAAATAVIKEIKND